MSRFFVRADPDLAGLIPGYLSRWRIAMVPLREALNCGDLATVQATAHKLKGTAGCYGFTGLGEISARLEDAARLGDVQSASAELAQAVAYLEHVEVDYA